MSSAITELNGPCTKGFIYVGSHACDWVPEREDMVRFLGLVLDEKLSSLVLHQEFQEELKYIEALVSSLASEVKFNYSVANIIETLTAEARAEQN
ncbi:hypothetical protein SADUNF_Sadunf12G0030000 [Salix dunnii]|uniref:Uncharacterized protein n=1 Tax=Salix dunnii TaxID=1413687 RepID=A0A835MS06_9ROSI|nr:hypothetical protein SADUNF_Sadunf12G0030000 [Salix dunnii]